MNKTLSNYLDKLPTRILFEKVDDETTILSNNNDVCFKIYDRQDLLGYEIYPKGKPGISFISDTDLYDLRMNPELRSEILKEILYMLDQYVADRISILSREYRTWYGMRTSKYTIKFALPDNTPITQDLPCINQIDIVPV